MEKYILTLDEGTTSARSMIIDKNGKIIALDQNEFTQYFPKAGWVEHDPVEIWNTQRTTMVQALNKAKIKGSQIEAIGITNQRETVVIWEKDTGLPIYNALVWQDQRTNEYCEGLPEETKKMVYEKTGLILNPYFSATKAKWILDNIPNARERAKKGELCFGTINTWLIYRLTGGEVIVSDRSNAQRTMLYNIHTNDWDQELLDLFEIPREMMPELKSNSEKYGETFAGLLSKTDLTRIPITSSIGDQQSALFGQLCHNKGEVKSTYGTGCFILMNTGDKTVWSKNGLLTTLAVDYGGKITYALEGSVMIAGSAIQWLRDGLRIIYSPLETEWYAGQVDDDRQVYVVPSFSGLGSPYWDNSSRGAIFGLDRGTAREHIVRATLESIAFQAYDVINAMKKDLNLDKINIIKVDGGVSRNSYLMQFQSELFGTEINRPENTETTAMGAAYLAGLAVGYWKDLDDIKKIYKSKEKWVPQADKKIMDKKIKGWHEAVKRTFNWLDDIK